jgi:ribonucleoside-diphosphate reductase alpha chain
MNILYFEEWKDTDAVQTMIYFLDAVMSEFITKSKDIKFFERAHRFAERHRALGLGVLGWHSFLQSKNIAFESLLAKSYNVSIYKHMDEESLIASKRLAKEYGEPEMLKGYGLRNTTRLAIAPTTSSSFILGQVSPSIEPLNSNYYVKDLSKGKFTYKNPYLKKLLKEKGIDTPKTWDSILKNNGSVLHLEELSEHDKDVFRTFDEISQMEIILQASIRQPYIDQSQSINLKIHPSTPVKDINALYIKAWELGIKTLYYQRSTNMAQELGRSILECRSCEA